MVQWLGVRASTEGSTGSIPGQETKIPQAAWHGEEKKKMRMRGRPSLEGQHRKWSLLCYNPCVPVGRTRALQTFGWSQEVSPGTSQCDTQSIILQVTTDPDAGKAEPQGEGNPKVPEAGWTNSPGSYCLACPGRFMD